MTPEQKVSLYKILETDYPYPETEDKLAEWMDAAVIAERAANIATIRQYLHRRAVLQHEIEECIAAIEARSD